MLKIVSFNVNGLNSFNKYVNEFYSCHLNEYIKNILKADILCIQETKGTRKSLEKFLILKDYKVYMSYNNIKNGVSGVCTIISKKLYLKSVTTKIENMKRYCDEGRVLIADFGNFKVANVYFPFFDPELIKNKELIDQKKHNVNEFYRLLGIYFDLNKEIIICGDFNAIYSIIDHYQFYREYKRIMELKNKNIEDDFFALEPHKMKIEKPLRNRTDLDFYFRSESALKEYLLEKNQRKWLYEFINKNTHVDSYRFFHKDVCEKYTAWNSIYNLRSKNLGSRIDFIMIPIKLSNFLCNASILDNLFGSDHCPVSVDIDIKILSGKDNLLTKETGILSFFKNLQK